VTTAIQETVDKLKYKAIAKKYLDEGIKSELALKNLLLALKEPRISTKVNCGKNHNSPFAFLYDVLSGAVTKFIVWANRSGSKSYLAGLMTWFQSGSHNLTETCILGGSESQAEKSYKAMNDFWRITDLQEDYLLKEPMITKTMWQNGSVASILTASQRSVRGPHPQKLILDEVDEMDYTVFEASLSQPQSKHNVPASIGIFSTNHNIDGTMDKALRLVEKHAYRLYKWCVWEVLESCRDFSCSTCKLSSICPGKHMKEANGYYKIQDFIDKLYLLSWDSLQREWLCEKIGRGDLVYQHQFDEDLHFINWPFDKNKEVFLSIDWGGVHPFSIGVWQNFEEWGWVRVDEVYRGNTTNPLIIKECKERPWWENINSGVADPSRADLRKEWEDKGISIYPADNDVDSGIEAVKNALKPVLGNPKIYFNRICLDTKREFLSYKIKNKKIVKENDHTCVAGDSLINTTSGDIPIRDLVGKEGYLYAYNGNRICAAKFNEVRKTGIQKEVWKVTYTDGKSIIATPDHPFMLRNGNYRCVKELKAGDSLMPFYKRIDHSESRVLVNHKIARIEFYGYEDVYNLTVEKYHNFACHGIIIHNCDEIRYFVKWKIKEGKVFALTTDDDGDFDVMPK